MEQTLLQQRKELHELKDMAKHAAEIRDNAKKQLQQVSCRHIKIQ
jgi:hypothetical protein